MYQVIKDADKEVVGNFKWFHFSQNNSGGYFIEDDEVGCDVFIQAVNASEASSKASQLFRNRSEFCECCGERWYYHVDDEDGEDVPMKYGESLEDSGSVFGKTAVLHYVNGKVERFIY